MNKRIKATVTREREVNMFAELSHGHSVLLDNAKQKRDGYLYEAMSCLVIAAFKSEAFLNDIGTRMFAHWEHIDRIPYKNKLLAITGHVGVAPDFGKRPFQTLSELFEARNELAHARPQTLTQEQTTETGTREELRRSKPLTKWEKLCTVEFAQRAYEDTEEIAELLWKAAGFDLKDLRQQGASYSISDVSE